MRTILYATIAFAAAIAAIAASWLWLGKPVQLARAPMTETTKLPCVSYAPFRGEQNPLDLSVRVSAEQMRQDLAQLAKITTCIRTYSIDNGLDQIPALAKEAGLKVIHGIWLGSGRELNRRQINTSIALAKAYPDTITSIVVGNEVLLRGEMSGADLAVLIRSVKEKVAPIPVTYADVWEFWLRHREVFDAVDFVTIHILPFWEDFPVRAKHAAAHVLEIRKRMEISLPGKEILIGETGWPSAGRMREGALPSPSSQARVISEILALAEREKFSINLIEAYDQPWKRRLEGTVGGYWGLIDADKRAFKIASAAISDHPHWRMQMAGGMGFAVLIFIAAFLGKRRRTHPSGPVLWVGVGLIAAAAGSLAGLSIEKMMVEALGLGGWLRHGVLNAAALAVALLGAYDWAAGRRLATFANVLGGNPHASMPPVKTILGYARIVATLMTTEAALGFVFDPRYRDFPFAALTIFAVPVVVSRLAQRGYEGEPAFSERLFAGILGLSAIYIGFNEGPANWQSLWMCGCFVALALSLWRARDVRIQES